MIRTDLVHFADAFKPSFTIRPKQGDQLSLPCNKMFSLLSKGNISYENNLQEK